jgi:hypothetical protein
MRAWEKANDVEASLRGDLEKMVPQVRFIRAEDVAVRNSVSSWQFKWLKMYPLAVKYVARINDTQQFENSCLPSPIRPLYEMKKSRRTSMH